jgi:AAA+ ATPase superfamily predicted ATPase
MLSPFPYDQISDSSQFFGREKALAVVSKSVKYANNLLIHSKRRMGKSSLIHHFFDTSEEKYLCIYVDIFDITTKEDFAYALLKALSNSQKTDLKSAIKTISSLFKRVRVEPTVDPTTLKYSLKPIIATLSFEEMMEDFFSSLETLGKEKQIVVAIDEFQQIATIKDVKLDAFLRKYIQKRGDVSYIFLGSKRHILTSLFHYKAPLYEMATHYELQPLLVEEIYHYAKKHLTIAQEEITYIYNRADGETKLIQHILHLLYVYKVDAISQENIDVIVEEIINSKEGSFRLLFDTLNNNQKIALKMVGQLKSGFFSVEVLQTYNIKKQTLQSAINTLFGKEFIDKEGDSYFIPDRAFELWVEQL